MPAQPAGALFPGAPADRPYPSLRQDQADGVEAAHGIGCQSDELAWMRGKPADPGAANVNGINVPGFSPGAAHASDPPYLFDLGGLDLLKTQPQQDLAASMIEYWTTFARTGDPDHAGAPRWPAGTAQGRLRLVPDRIRPVDAAAEHQCGFWSTIR